MTVNTTEFKQTFVGNSTAEEFTCQFKIISSDDIVVTHADGSGVETELVLGTDFSVTGAGNEEGFSITFPLEASSFSTLSTNETLLVTREPDIVQETDLRNQGNYNPESVEDALDRIIMILQWLDTAVKDAANEGNAVDFKNRRGINAADPINNQDVVTLAYLTEALTNVGAGAGVTIDKWAGTTDGGATYPIAGAVLDDPNGYIVVLGGVIQEPTTDFTVDTGTEILTFTSTPTTGVPYFIIATGLVNTINQYPVTLNSKITQHVGSYICSGTDTYTLTSVTGQQAATSLRNRQIFFFSTPNANTSTTVTFNPDGLGALTAVMEDGSTAPGVGYFTAGTKVYIAMYEQSSNKLRMVYPSASVGGGGGVTRVESGAISGVNEYAFTGIPAGVNSITVSWHDIQPLSSNTAFMLRVGYGSTTYLSANYVGEMSDTSDDSDGILLGASVTSTATFNGKACFERVYNDVWVCSITSVIVTSGGNPNSYRSGSYSVDVGADITAIKMVRKTGSQNITGRITLSYS